MTGLINFLNARLDEVEADAIAACGASQGDWWHQEAERVNDSAPWRAQIESGDGRVADLIDVGLLAGPHIGRHTPQAVKVDVAAKRRIIGLVELEFNDEGEPVFLGGYGECYWDTIRLLASAFDQHPDYRPEWRP